MSQSATPLVLLVGKVAASPSAFVFGADLHGFFVRRLVFDAGAAPGAGTIAIGSGLAASLHLKPGAKLTVEGHRLTVSGVYHSGITYEDEGAVLPLALGAGDQRPGRARRPRSRSSWRRAPARRPRRARSSATSRARR